MRVNESHQHQRRFSLAGQTNAHKTNTKEQFAEALKGHADWFEGDIRKELHGSRVEMRHDTGARAVTTSRSRSGSRRARRAGAS